MPVNHHTIDFLSNIHVSYCYSQSAEMKLAIIRLRMHADKNSSKEATMRDLPSNKEQTPVTTTATAVPELERRLSGMQ